MFRGIRRQLFTGVWMLAMLVITATICSGKYSGGTGDPCDPYQIATKTDLLALAANTTDYNQCFILTADIDMQGQVFTGAIIAANSGSSPSFQGTPFTGTFDGNGHKILSFTTNAADFTYVGGLFGCIYGGSVKNLGLENFSVSGLNYVGSLVGVNYGTISDCYSTGSVSGSGGAGGLVGDNSGIISNCYSTGAVSGASYFVGGLVGYNYQGTLTSCYATGSVSGYEYVGGLAGANYSIITNCYSTGSVSGTYDVGGLVGYKEDSSSFNSSFWDINTSGQTTSAGGIGKTTAQMKQTSTFANWDFIETWGIIENQTYPYLMTGPAADLNHDKKVDFADFAIFAENWLSSD